MDIEHLSERVLDYSKSIETVVDKKTIWGSQTKKLLMDTLTKIVEKYDIGWRVQELSWINYNEAVNITFDSFPPALIEKTNLIPSYQFVQGGALVFSQSYSGDVYVFIVFPQLDNAMLDPNKVEYGMFQPKDITEKLIIQKVDVFLKEMIDWEVPEIKKTKVGFQS